MNRGVVIAAVAPVAAASAVLRAAHGAAEALDTRVRVLTAIEPLPLLPSDHPMAAPIQIVQLELAKELHARLREEARAWADQDAISFDLVVGQAERTICEAAEAWKAELVVMGLRRHSRADRMLGGETSVKVSRESPVTTLAIREGTPGRPSRVVVGVEFGAAARHAARAATEIATPGANIYLLHVRPSLNVAPVDDAAWVRVYEEGARALLDEIDGELHASRRDVRVESRIVTGYPEEQLLLEIERTQAQCVAVGRHTRGTLERMLLGSVATSMLRESPCAVLVAPPDREA